jgi:hypothetical protein
MELQDYNTLCYLNGASEAPDASEQSRASVAAANLLLRR